MNLKSEKGQTIIEAIVALAAIFIIVVAITIAIVNAVNNSQFVKNQNLANKFAQQGMEQIRRIKADDIVEFKDMSGSFSYSDDGNGIVSGETTEVNVNNTHIRNIYLSDNDPPCFDDDSQIGGLTKVTVVVDWSSGKCDTDDRFCHNTTLISCISYEPKGNVLP